MLSIIIPAFNVEKYLSRCVDSLLRQDYNDSEIILVDDGSTDLTKTICDKYASNYKNIKVIHQKNSGSYIARMRGVKYASGDCVAFVDSDDWVEKNYILEFMEKYNELSCNGIDIVVGSYLREESGEQKILFKSCGEFTLSGDATLKELMERNYFDWSVYAKIYRKELFNDVINTVKKPKTYGDDIYLNWLLFRKAKKIFYTPLNGYHYCVRENSLMTSYFSRKRMDDIKIREYIFKAEMKSRASKDLLFAIASAMYKDCWPYIKKMAKFHGSYEKIIRKYAKKIYRCMLKTGYLLTDKQRKDMKYYINYEYKKHIDIEKKKSKKIFTLATKLRQRYEKVYIYGMGRIAMEIATYLEKNSIDWEGFIVTKKEVNIRAKENPFVENKEILSVNELMETKSKANVGIIIAMNQKNTYSVIDNLKALDDAQLVNLGKYSFSYV